MPEGSKKQDTYNILVIEDNAAHAQLIIRSLNDAPIDITIHHIDDGEKALEFIHCNGQYAAPNNPPTPDLILLDLKLPKVSGHAILYDLKTTDKLKAIPVVMLTTSDADTDVATAYENRANSYLTKPVDFEEFNTMIQDLAMYWFKTNKRHVVNVVT